MLREILRAALVAMILADCIFAPGSARSDEVKGVALVKVDDPTKGSLPEIVYGHGTVEPISTKTESFQRDGQVLEIMVEVGDQFKKGDPLLDFGAAPAAIVAYEQAKTALRLAEGTRARMAALVKLKLATQDALDAAEKAVSDAQLTKEMYEKQGSIKPSEILQAPFDGVVTAISVAKGDRVAAGTALMTLAQTDHVRLSIGIEPTQLEKVKIGLPVDLQSGLGGATLESQVRGLGAAIDLKSRLVPVTVEMPAKAVLPGQIVTAGIKVGEVSGWTVPRDAVMYDKKGAFVFQVDEMHAKRIDVNVLGSVDETSVIEGNIKPDLKLVVWGSYQLGDGDAVRTEVAGEGEAENRAGPGAQ
jgi:RND family efflux transporter MFP subunit